MSDVFDIAIVGGGVIATSLVNALKNTPLSVAVIEATAANLRLDDDFDGRTFALSMASKRFFETTGCWSNDLDISEIRAIQVSQKGRFSTSRFVADSAGIDAFGYIVSAQRLIKILYENARLRANVTWLNPVTCDSIDYLEEYAQLSISGNGQQQKIRARLVVGADGAKSTVREDAEIEAHHYDYQQTAIVVTIGLSKAHHHIAYERFTAKGPMAVLPLSRNRAGVVWSVPTSAINEYLSLSDSDFIERFQEDFGYRLGKIVTLGKRFSYPLHLLVAKKVVNPRLAIIGNAAQSLHPVAGQGFNLGLRDVAILAETIHDALMQHEDFASQAVLQRYADTRHTQQQRIIRLTDVLGKWFVPDTFLLPFIRDLGLGLINLLGPVQSRFLRVAMGLEDKLPSLMCGIPLSVTRSIGQDN